MSGNNHVTSDLRYIMDGRLVSSSDISNPDAYMPTAEDQADSQVERARRSLVGFQATATKWPEMREAAEKVAPLVEKADNLFAQREDARSRMAVATRERDAAARVALGKGADPQEAEKAASEALNAATEDAERFARYYRETARLAAGESARGDRKLAELRREAAPENLVVSLRNLADARREALDAVEDARRKLAAIPGLVYGIRRLANEAESSELAKMVDNHFDPSARRLGSGALTYEGLLSELSYVQHRLSFHGATNPVDLGNGFGIAVRYAVENADAESADAAIRRDRSEHATRVAEGAAHGPFRPRVAE